MICTQQHRFFFSYVAICYILIYEELIQNTRLWSAHNDQFSWRCLPSMKYSVANVHSE